MENNALWCTKKGVNVLGTADFTHPEWFAEIETKLVEAEPGLYRLKSGEYPDVRYMLTTEVSQIYKKGDKTRRIHNLLLAPSLESVRRINAWLTEQEFNLKADGRPILGIDSEELYKRLKDIDERIVMIPAHAWTPWFSVFGSKSGFDSLEDCYGDMTKYIFAIETGLSSDILMNRSLSALDKFSIISNSDAHSPQNFGREANVFEITDGDFSFDGFMKILQQQNRQKFLYTIEFFPEEGKYHVDGHADCGITLHPEETRRRGGMCPKCGRLLTIGVLSRVDQLADRKDLQLVPKQFVPQRSIVPLPEIIAAALRVKSVNSKKVVTAYEDIIKKLGSEFYILLDAPLSDIATAAGNEVAEAVRRVRQGELSITPGFDGIYGKVKIFADQEQLRHSQQALL